MTIVRGRRAKVRHGSSARGPGLVLAAGLVAVALPVVGGCPGPSVGGGGAGASGPACPLEFFGDPSAAPELELLTVDAASVGSALSDGGGIELVFPPQGGRVVFAGVRVKNFDACRVQLTGSLRDTASNKIVFDSRTVNLAPRDGGEWVGSVDDDISTFANIPVCPNQWASVDGFGVPMQLELELRARDGQLLERVIDVVPFCAAGDDECLCQCKEGYVLGEVCS
jgi:hypothetical protein